MNPLDFPLLADENIHPDVTATLREWGKDVRSVVELGLGGQGDRVVLQTAHASGRVVLSHDSDFGALAIDRGLPLIGIVHLRPGHISASFVVELLAAIDKSDMLVEAPFLMVAERRGNRVRLRVRSPAYPPQG